MKKGVYKRAQGEQFNWIFVIVAGAIILAFFSVFTAKYIQLQQLKQNVEIGRNFAKSIDILENSPIVGKERGMSIDDNDRLEDGASKIGVKAEMDYSCSEDETSVVFNREQRSVQHLEKDVLFAPARMEINSLDMWILPWYFPFFVSNVIYLSDPKAEYFFVYDIPANEKFVKELAVPSNIKVEKVQISKLDARGGTNGRFVFFTGDKRSLTTRIPELAKKYENVNFEHVTVSGSDSEIGDVTFFDSSGKEKGKAKYYGKPLLWGAIFSDDIDTFNCASNKTLNKINAVAEVYATKADLLARNEKQECNNFYNAMKQTLLKLTGKEFFRSGYSSRGTLELENNDLAGKGCSYVY